MEDEQVKEEDEETLGVWEIPGAATGVCPHAANTATEVTNDRTSMVDATTVDERRDPVGP